jgi:transcriptional accessory protein Tex/SPT6
MDLDQMTPRQIVAGLMRGDADSKKLGYTPENAVQAVVNLKGLDPAGASGDLLAYAEGFVDGLVEDPENIYMPYRRSDAEINPIL